MKINKFILAILLTASLFTQSCRKGSMWGIRGEGDNVNETLTLSSFNAVDISVNANVSYTSDSVYRVELNGQKNILSVLEAKVEGGELKFDFKRNVWKYNQLNIIIHSPVMNKMTISGNGNIFVENILTGTNLDLDVSGSGNISVASVSLQSMNAKISGSGNVTINDGSCSSVYCNISGNGNLRSEFLTADFGDVKLSGSGDVTIHATQTLNVKISGNGNVKYRGNPVITSDISGNGKLIHIN